MVWGWNCCQWRVLNQRWKRTKKALNHTSSSANSRVKHTEQFQHHRCVKKGWTVLGISVWLCSFTGAKMPSCSPRCLGNLWAWVRNTRQQFVEDWRRLLILSFVILYPVFCLMRKPDRCKPPSVHPTSQGLFKSALGHWVETWRPDGLPARQLHSRPRPGDELASREDKQMQPPTEAVAPLCDEGALSRLEEISLLKAPWGLGLTWSLCPPSRTTSCRDHVVPSGGQTQRAIVTLALTERGRSTWRKEKCGKDGFVSPSGIFREGGCEISLAVNHLTKRVAFPSQT